MTSNNINTIDELKAYINQPRFHTLKITNKIVKKIYDERGTERSPTEFPTNSPLADMIAYINYHMEMGYTEVLRTDDTIRCSRPRVLTREYVIERLQYLVKWDVRSDLRDLKNELTRRIQSITKQRSNLDLDITEHTKLAIEYNKLNDMLALVSETLNNEIPIPDDIDLSKFGL